MINEIGEAWYNLAGPENDVVLSTRVRLARNLVNFPFPSRFSRDDGECVQTLVFDAFSRVEQPERYQALSIKKLDSLGKKILLERGVLTKEYLENPVSGIVVRTDGRLACVVNTEDHVRISSFGAGFDARTVYKLAKTTDDSLQNIIQFAASVEFGYLTARLANLGTGAKVSLFVHLPSLTYLNRETKDLTNLFTSVEEEGFSVSPCFGLTIHADNSFSPALGDCYQISTNLCFNGTEEDQIFALNQRVRMLIDLERLQREKIADTKPTALRDSVYKALAVVKYSRFLLERESIDLLFRIKWGRDAGILTGIEDFQLSGLLYRIRDAHISFVNRSERFKFEKDVNVAEAQTERLRSLIMQEALENVQIYA